MKKLILFLLFLLSSVANATSTANTTSADNKVIEVIDMQNVRIYVLCINGYIFYRDSYGGSLIQAFERHNYNGISVPVLCKYYGGKQ